MCLSLRLHIHPTSYPFKITRNSRGFPGSARSCSGALRFLLELASQGCRSNFSVFHPRLALGEIRLGAGASHSLFRKMLSQQKRCGVGSRRWNKLVGLVVVGVESPMVEGGGCSRRRLTSCKTLGEVTPAKEHAFWGNTTDLVKSGRGLCKDAAVTPSPVTGWGRRGG